MQNVWARYSRSCDRRHGLSAGTGQHFLLDTGTVSVLADCHHGIPAVKTWNAPLSGYVSATAERKTDVAERTTP